jgi:hypothetical protein
MKQWLPIWLKQWLWWVFRSPQRKVIGMDSLWTDTKGYFSKKFKRGKKNQAITICIGIKDRSAHLLDHLLPSLNKCSLRQLIKLSVYDAGSNDTGDLETAIKNAWDGELTYRKEEQAFTRSKTFNEAIMQAGTELVMACDADISLPPDIVKKVNRYVSDGTAWFPQVWWLNEDKEGGRFFTEGTGIFASTKRNFIRAGKYDESIKEWGKEDWLLFFGFYKAGISCVRTNEIEMAHLPHQSLKPQDFVKLF